MISAFQLRLAAFASAPARRDFGPPGREDRFVWTRQQEVVRRRRHLVRAWVHRNEERTAYAANMHLAMRRDLIRFGTSVS